MKKLIAIILLLIPISAFAYTSPGNPDGFVNDFAGVLSNSSKRELESILNKYEKETGNEVTVAIIPELVDETIETYAVRLFEDWGIGKQKQDNGALFLVSVADRKMRIEVGYGLEGDLTDIESKHIVSTVVPPYFRNNDYDEGVRAAVIGMIAGIGVEMIPDGGATAGSTRKEGGIADFFWVFIFGFMWAGSVFARSRSWWAGGVVGLVIGIIVLIFGGGWWYIPGLVLFGLAFDYLVSTKYKKFFMKGHHHSLAWPLIFLMGGRPGRRWDKGGGFGGFGGGFSGGGGASGDW
tara:strand:+ start:176 stop:1054 length:879 start_codon:yes stop_codon:yes gene_type:complete